MTDFPTPTPWMLDPKCLKCGHDVVGIAHKDGGESRGKSWPEHLLCVCQRCMYTWWMACRDLPNVNADAAIPSTES